jgi:membrane protease subunit (stomatin/prohibitin family)
MAETLDFTRNYSDISTEQGFQYEFFCNCCGNGKRTSFRPFGLNGVTGVMDTASSLLGGFFSSAANVAGRVSSAAYERAHEAAFIEAAKEIKPFYVQCSRCNQWVCKERCWNTKKGLCKSCAPDLGVEMAAAQSSKTVAEAWENASTSEEDKKIIATGNFKETVHATCPDCGKPLASAAKFCPECGAKIQKAAHCTECGAKLAPGAKFCAECGTKAGG